MENNINNARQYIILFEKKNSPETCWTDLDDGMSAELITAHAGRGGRSSAVIAT